MNISDLLYICCIQGDADYELSVEQPDPSLQPGILINEIYEKSRSGTRGLHAGDGSVKYYKLRINKNYNSMVYFQ